MSNLRSNDQTGGSSGATGGAAGATNVAAPPTARSRALEAQHYRKIEDLMSSWETRVKRQVVEFNRFAESVSLLDLQLCDTVSKLEKVQQQKEQAEKRQQEVDASLSQIEDHQKFLLRALGEIETELAAASSQHPSSSTNELMAVNGYGLSNNGTTVPQQQQHELPDAVRALSTLVNDTHERVSALTDQTNKLQRELYPGSLGTLVSALTLQQESLLLLEKQTDMLKDKMTSLEKI